jgi:hypothetical protein
MITATVNVASLPSEWNQTKGVLEKLFGEDTEDGTVDLDYPTICREAKAHGGAGHYLELNPLT